MSDTERAWTLPWTALPDEGDRRAAYALLHAAEALRARMERSGLPEAACWPETRELADAAADVRHRVGALRVIAWSVFPSLHGKRWRLWAFARLEDLGDRYDGGTLLALQACIVDSDTQGARSLGTLGVRFDVDGATYVGHGALMMHCRLIALRVAEQPRDLTLLAMSSGHTHYGRRWAASKLREMQRSLT